MQPRPSDRRPLNVIHPERTTLENIYVHLDLSEVRKRCSTVLQRLSGLYAKTTEASSARATGDGCGAAAGSRGSGATSAGRAATSCCRTASCCTPRASYAGAIAIGPLATAGSASLDKHVLEFSA
jgi:hypothetical protein